MIVIPNNNYYLLLKILYMVDIYLITIIKFVRLKNVTTQVKYCSVSMISEFIGFDFNYAVFD